MLTSAALSSGGPAEGGGALAPGGVIAICMALPLVYLGSIGARTLLRGRPITPFEVTQAGAALLVGFSGAVRVITMSGADPTFVGIGALLLGAACYAAALTFIDRRLGRGRNFYSYTTLAGLLVLTGSCADPRRRRARADLVRFWPSSRPDSAGASTGSR